ncbi:HAMP domain-containing protein [Paenibacillus sp. S150]|uniref:HAMP domain-containing protein n=1 Tax=Paenibacillus sp. S150 TaxID=2749826 RepID=UPI001C59BE44|nr:HAMP domain-containing protein [Paenibacillus sp. S150]MBW4079917.1 HAMP domain-containing protein [Paenibacillus sp. S150]
MKFWQKASLCSLVIFLIGFDLAVLLFTAKSYSLSKEQTYTAAENERYIIQKSLQSRLSSVAPLYEELNANNLKMYLKPYADYYQNQAIYMAFYENDGLIYSNFPQPLYNQPELQVQPGEQSSLTREADDVLYYIVTGRLEEPYSGLKFSYMKNIQSLADYKTEMIRHATVLGIVVPAFLSLILTGMLLQLTAPLRALNQTTKEIAKGHYRERAAMTGTDELGELAGSFNQMAESVEAHLHKLTKLMEERQRFIHNLAHEMRTPVTAIMGYGEFLGRANYTPEEGIKACP